LRKVGIDLKKENIKLKRALLLAFICLLCLPFVAAAQNRDRTTTKNPPATSVRADAENVANQIKNLARFVYLLGSITKDIEIIDADARKGKASKAVINQNQQAKAKLVESFVNWRVAMEDFESKFKTKTPLIKYLSKVSGVAILATTAENQARAGQFSQAGQTLLQIINKLTDVLLEMP
jgi:hypothetical protein